MSDATSSSSTLISSPKVETSTPKMVLGLRWSWMALTTCYGHMHSAFSLVLRTNWLTYFSLHPLIQIPRVWPNLLDIILWCDSSTV